MVNVLLFVGYIILNLWMNLSAYKFSTLELYGVTFIYLSICLPVLFVQFLFKIWKVIHVKSF